MALELYNTLTRKRETFRPIDRTRVRLYVCGPTVWNFAHIGNARTFVVFDQLFRVLRHEYGETAVVYVRNITDIDDKIIDAAKAEGVEIDAVTRRTAAAFRADMDTLRCLPPSFEPHATAFVEAMLSMIGELVANGHAYAAAGHVLFDVTRYPHYGQLSGRRLDDMLAGARVEVAPYKRNPGDFILWKPSTEDQPGWVSTWGRGRPGWHIECSAMGAQHLGRHFDIHGGGIDLIFPHHENEIAQSAAAHGGEALANFWMHVSFLDVEGQKMSKSLGNVLLVRDLARNWSGEVLRWALLSAHYRDPLDFTEERLGQAQASLDRLYRALRRVEAVVPVYPDRPEVLHALNEDLNTPLALGILHDLGGALNKSESPSDQARAKGELLAAGSLLGLLAEAPQAWLHGQTAEETADETALDAAAIERHIADRRTARARKDFAEADRLRRLLANAGVALEDGPDGTIWRRTR